MPDWLIILILVVVLALVVVLCVVAWPWSVIILLGLGALVALTILIASYLGADVQGFFSNIRSYLIDNAPLFTQVVRKVKAIGRALFNF